MGANTLPVNARSNSVGANTLPVNARSDSECANPLPVNARSDSDGATTAAITTAYASPLLHSSRRMRSFVRSVRVTMADAVSAARNSPSTPNPGTT